MIRKPARTRRIHALLLIAFVAVHVVFGGCVSSQQQSAYWSYCSYQVLTRGENSVVCPNADGWPNPTANLASAVGAPPAVVLAPPVTPSPPGRVESSCDRYQRLRRDPLPAFRAAFFEGSSCSRNGPFVAQTCLSICRELGLLMEQRKTSELAATEEHAVQILTDATARLRKLEHEAAADLNRLTAAVPLSDGDAPASPPEEESFHCRRYIRLFADRSLDFLGASGARSRCWKGERSLAMQCNRRCEKLLIETHQSTPSPDLSPHFSPPSTDVHRTGRVGAVFSDFRT